MTDYKAIVADIFAKYDSDKDGTLSPAELQEFFGQLSAKHSDLGDFAAWFAKVDKDGSGTLSAEDLEEYLASIGYTA